jgi:hypothetical protein
LGYDYWDDKQDAAGPGTAWPGLQPGHGTATLALLAGNTTDLTFGKHRFQGDIGGAGDAEVIPVRISPSVIHVYTSTMAKGLYRGLAPGGSAFNRCDVVSISHGGLPSASWASSADTVSFPFWRLLLGLAPPQSEEERMSARDLLLPSGEERSR